MLSRVIMRSSSSDLNDLQVDFVLDRVRVGVGGQDLNARHDLGVELPPRAEHSRVREVLVRAIAERFAREAAGTKALVVELEAERQGVRRNALGRDDGENALREVRLP